MKKILLVGLLVCAILASVVTGTLAVYSVSLDEISGDVVAKTFVLDQNAVEGFNDTVKIAPTEQQVYVFTITNEKNGAVSETTIDVSTKLSLGNSLGKSAIGNLTVAIERSEDGNTWTDVTVAPEAFVSGVGEVTLEDTLVTAATASTVYYRVTVAWPSSDNDNDYMGSNFGSKLAVKVTGTQHTEA